jgi:hypothetical protein
VSSVLNYRPPAGSPLAEADTVVLPRVVDADATQLLPVVRPRPADECPMSAPEYRAWWAGYAAGRQDAARDGAR